MSGWVEDLHPREHDGKFTDKPGGGNSWIGKLSQRMGSDLSVQNRADVQKWWDGLSKGDRQTVRDTIHNQSRKPINVRLNLESLRRLVAGHGMQTSHDSGHKGAQYDAHRKAWEEQHGLHNPVYGYVGDPGSLDLYYDHEVTLKRDARKRTTVSVGDSLNGETNISPIDSVGGLGDNHLLDLISKVETQPGGLSMGRMKQYMEAQIAGGVNLADVSEVHVPSGTDPNLISALEAAGIKVTVQLSEDELALEAARKALGL